jgi:SAM-dependent methyltransferase
MTLSRALPRSLAALSFVAVAGLTSLEAQSPGSYKPREYQPGKDVVWVPTAQPLVEAMLDMAKVTPSDYVIDLGSGDGRTVIAAARRGAKALGVEYNPDMVALSRQNAEKAGVAGRASFVQADLFKTDFSSATVLTLFLLPEINLKLRPSILAMKPGTRVVSNSFDMGDWRADQVIASVGNCRAFCSAFFWVVPAKVEGTWQLGEGRLVLEQTYQMLKGTLTSGNVVAPVKGKLTGAEIAFTAGGTEYKGRVSGDAMEGTRTTAGKAAPWRATRAAK